MVFKKDGENALRLREEFLVRPLLCIYYLLASYLVNLKDLSNIIRLRIDRENVKGLLK